MRSNEKDIIDRARAAAKELRSHRIAAHTAMAEELESCANELETGAITIPLSKGRIINFPDKESS